MPTINEILGVTPSSPVSGDVLSVLDTGTDYDAMDKEYLGGNTWSNIFGIATDHMQKSLYGGLGVIADKLDDYLPENAASLKQYAEEGKQYELQSLAYRPEPTRSVEITEAWKDIKKEADEGDVVEEKALSRILKLEDDLADAKLEIKSLTKQLNEPILKDNVETLDKEQVVAKGTYNPLDAI